MGYPTKVQVIRRQDSEQWYINFPAPLARALEFDKGEVVEWVIQDRHGRYAPGRRQTPPARLALAAAGSDRRRDGAAARGLPRRRVPPDGGLLLACR